jgi:hypothetical protein
LLLRDLASYYTIIINYIKLFFIIHFVNNINVNNINNKDKSINTSNNKYLNNTNFNQSLDIATTIKNNYFDKINSTNCKNRFNSLQFPIINETLEFQISIYKNLIQELNSYPPNHKLIKNITTEETNALKRFNKEKPFIICQCDKNVGSAIISHENYINITEDHLNNDNYYTKLDENPLDELIIKVNDKLEDLLINKHISKKLFRSFKVDKPELGKFRSLPKLHKNKFGIRPIINCMKQPTNNICFFIDCILQQHVIQMDSFIKDSTTILQSCNNLFFTNINEIQLISADFESLYTNIKHDDAIDIISEIIEDNEDYDKHGFIELLKLVLYNNFFTFNNCFYHQIRGIAMGIKCGPSIANLVVHKYEKVWLNNNHPIIYKRFIDDIFIITSDQNSIISLKDSFNYLKLNIITGTSVIFLDLNISLNFVLKTLNFTLHIKPTNTFSYLLYNSNHPLSIKENIPKSLFIRVRRICSNIQDYYFFSYTIAFELEKRGFDLKTLFKIINNISKLDRNHLLKYKNKKINKFNNYNTKKFILKYYYDNNITNLENIFKRSFLDNFSNLHLYNNVKLLSIRKLLPNLISSFCFNFKTPFIKKSFCNKCINLNCNICHYLNSNSIIPFNLSNQNIGIPIQKNSNCNSSCIIYFIFCNLCNAYYIGHSSKSAKIRIQQHIYNIKNCIPYTKNISCVALHFNLKNHNYKKNFSFYIFDSNLTLIERLNFESFFINLFKKCNFYIINDSIPKLFQRRINFT